MSVGANAVVPALDLGYCTEVLLDLLGVPSPTGFTERAVARVEERLAEIGVEGRRTPKGALVWTLPGAGGAGGARTVTVHIDTLGAMVKRVKPSGRLALTNLGSYDWATVEGAECRVHTLDGGEITGTVVNIKQSSHVFGRALRELVRTDATLEVRLDALAGSEDEVRALGVEVGDVVSFDSGARRTPEGFVKGRHLDNKAAVAVALCVTKALRDAALAPAVDTHLFVSNYEEVGHGAAAGIPADTTELLCVDMAAVGPGQASDERCVTLCVKDSSGPYDRTMSARLRRLAKRRGIDLKVDIYPFYNSDASAALRAGGAFRAALVGPGVDASHAYERTHEDALAATADLLLAYLLEPVEGPEVPSASPRDGRADAGRVD